MKLYSTLRDSPIKEVLWRLPRAEVVTQVQNFIQFLGLHKLSESGVGVDIEIVNYNNRETWLQTSACPIHNRWQINQVTPDLVFLAANVQDDRLVVLVGGDGDHARLAVVPVHGHGGVPPVLEPDQGSRPPPYLLKYYHVIIFHPNIRLPTSSPGPASCCTPDPGPATVSAPAACQILLL